MNTSEIKELETLGMRVELFLRREEYTAELVAKLKEDRRDIAIGGKEPNGNLAIFLPLEKAYDKTIQFIIPPYVSGGTVMVVAGERGERFKKQLGGSACVITGPDGQKLLPFWIVRNPELHGAQAYFSSPWGLCIAHSVWGPDGYFVKVFQIKFKKRIKNTAHLAAKIKFEGQWDPGKENYGIDLNGELEKSIRLQKLFPAIIAAIKKSLTLEAQICYAKIPSKPRADK